MIMSSDYKEVMKELINKFNLTDSEALKLFEVPHLILDRFPYNFTTTDDGKFLIYAEFYRIDKNVKARIRSQLDVINGGKALEELNKKAVKFLEKCTDNNVTIPAPDDESDILAMLDDGDEDLFDPGDTPNSGGVKEEDDFFDERPGIDIDDLFGDGI